jgi:hypothetical protein
VEKNYRFYFFQGLAIFPCKYRKHLFFILFFAFVRKFAQIIMAGGGKLDPIITVQLRMEMLEASIIQ